MKGPKNSKPKKELHKYIIPLFYLKGENGYVIKGFGREYNSKNDFQIGDLDNSEIKELYQNRPDLFNDYKTKKLLVDLGVINKDELLTSFIVNIEPHQLKYFLGNDRRWGNGTFYEAILINSWEIWNVDLQYYEPEDLISSVDENNLLKIKKILSEENNQDLRDVPLDEILDYDGFDNIGEELRKSANIVDGDAYGDYLYGQLKKALEEYGKVISMNDEGIELEVDIKIIDDINDEDLSEFMGICNDNLECVFSEAIYVGSIDLPRPHFDDDWYNWNFDEQYFNEVLSDYLAEYL
jgi:hypothetical protein